MRIYSVHVSLESDRPQIDFTLPQNKNNDWSLVDDVVRGEVPPDKYKPVRVIVDEKAAKGWDLLGVPGTFGLYSKRALDVIPKRALDAFILLEAWVNLLPFYFLHPLRTLKCLDLAKAQVTTFPNNPARIMSVEKFAFVPGVIADPLVFCPSEFKLLLMTESVVDSLIQAGCKGLLGKLAGST